MKKHLKIAIVAGETSGDILGAGLIRELKLQSNVEIEFSGIGGEQMAKQGFVSEAEMEKLSIIGFEGLWGNLRHILSIRKHLEQRLKSDPPDVFIGIDVPDFNLTLELRLRKAGIKTIHYVSPTVWAWRSYRIHKIRKAVSLMLTLFPFEKKYYQQHNVPVEYVGHPIAKKLNPVVNENDIDPEIVAFKQSHQNHKCIAVLPGSRRSEIKTLGQLFLDTVKTIHQRESNSIFLLPVANKSTGEMLQEMLSNHPNKEYLKQCLYFFHGEHSADIIRISDVVLLASGTAALESALLAKPTVVAYKLSLITSLFVRFTTTVKHFSMPNHLLEKPVVPEFMQSNATAENLSNAVLRYLKDETLYAETSQQLAGIHAELDKNSDRRAASAVLKHIAAS